MFSVLQSRNGSFIRMENEVVVFNDSEFQVPDFPGFNDRLQIVNEPSAQGDNHPSHGYQPHTIHIQPEGPRPTRRNRVSSGVIGYQPHTISQVGVAKRPISDPKNR